jgi:hypothetical protein
LTLKKPSLEEYFIRTNFYDLMPLSIQISNDLGFEQDEIVEAVCKVYEKSCMFPPTYNRTAWYRTVFTEKLYEARSDILKSKANNLY